MSHPSPFAVRTDSLVPAVSRPEIAAALSSTPRPERDPRQTRAQMLSYAGAAVVLVVVCIAFARSDPRLIAVVALLAVGAAAYTVIPARRRRRKRAADVAVLRRMAHANQLELTLDAPAPARPGTAFGFGDHQSSPVRFIHRPSGIEMGNFRYFTSAVPGKAFQEFGYVIIPRRGDAPLPARAAEGALGRASIAVSRDLHELPKVDVPSAERHYHVEHFPQVSVVYIHITFTFTAEWAWRRIEAIVRHETAQSIV
ncbi:hypothetical protein [Herbiconiux sp. YIM B11900]|uniref:hypothetical protein n=1 Tax=Herbiconiux sp. YIM B11900 TaxID=3404131 RepID=UPI003F877D97